MATIFTFPCGGCGRRYSVYYPKALLYELSGSGTREMGDAEDAEDARTGAVEAARRRAEAAGNIWVNATDTQAMVCACGKRLDLNIAHHPRVPQAKGVSGGRQTGFIQFPSKATPTDGGHGRHGSSQS
ncbi:MAG TPA: hypothetical protein VGR25_07845 [bacterium]|jgi:hypothetical protein|nr:hypothetical protein [bacterium]